jgi:hypothetical protein
MRRYTMKSKVSILVLALVLSLLVVGSALANNGIERPRWVVSGGASDSTGSGGVALRATLGQPVVGIVAGSGGDVTLGQGFWFGGTSEYSIYLPLVLRQT